MGSNEEGEIMRAWIGRKGIHILNKIPGYFPKIFMFLYKMTWKKE